MPSSVSSMFVPTVKTSIVCVVKLASVSSMETTVADPAAGKLKKPDSCVLKGKLLSSMLSVGSRCGINLQTCIT